jgi:hypothetical protein
MTFIGPSAHACDGGIRCGNISTVRIIIDETTNDLSPNQNPKSRTNALLSATAGLDDADLDEVRLYTAVPKVPAPGERERGSSDALL